MLRTVMAGTPSAPHVHCRGPSPHGWLAHEILQPRPTRVLLRNIVDAYVLNGPDASSKTVW